MSIPEKEMTEAEVKEFKKLYIQTAERSYINDRLNVPLPPHLHGEWIGTDAFSQFNAKARGFIDGKDYLTETNIMHQTPGDNVFADVKFMVMSKQKHMAMVEVDALIARKRSGIGRDKDEEYQALAENLGLGVDKSERSTARVLQGAEVNSTIKR